MRPSLGLSIYLPSNVQDSIEKASCGNSYCLLERLKIIKVQEWESREDEEKHRSSKTEWKVSLVF